MSTREYIKVVDKISTNSRRENKDMKDNDYMAMTDKIEEFYTVNGITFTILSLNGDMKRIFEKNYIALQNLTEEQRNNPNYLREVHAADTIAELKAECRGIFQNQRRENNYEISWTRNQKNQNGLGRE